MSETSFSHLSADRLRRWEKLLAAVPGVDRVAILLRETELSVERFPIADLIPAGDRSPRTLAERPAVGMGTAAAGSTPAASAPALCDGGPLADPDRLPSLLPELLVRATELHPERGVTYVGADRSESFQSYAELLEQSRRVAAGLGQAGLRSGDKTLFHFLDNHSFITCFWACQIIGAVPIPVGASAGLGGQEQGWARLASAWRFLEAPMVLSNRAMAEGLRAAARKEGLDGFTVTAIEDLPADRSQTQAARRRPDDVALMLLTSGSTGTPKLVQQSHAALLWRSAGTIQLNGFTDREVSLNWMPLEHVGGIVMWHLRDVFLGCRQIHLPTELVLGDPLLWLDSVDRHRATLTWAPNFAFGLVNERLASGPERSWSLACLRHILNGGEAVVARTARRFLRLLAPFGLPPDAMRPAWGMSETCSGVTHSDRFLLDSTRDEDAHVEVGRPIPGISLRIVDQDNAVVQAGRVGRLQVQGRCVTTGYFNNLELNRQLFTDGGWFETGDLGVIQDGALTITGRAKDEIIVNGANFHCYDIEAAAESVRGVEVSYTAACSVRSPEDNTDRVAVFFHPSGSDWDAQIQLISLIRRQVLKQCGLNPDYIIPVSREEIPKTEIGKIQRSRLSQRFSEGAFEAVLRRLRTHFGEGTLPQWFFRQTWIGEPLGSPGQLPQAGGVVLIFADTLGLASEVRSQLRQKGVATIEVRAGRDFRKEAADCYRVQPGNPQHFGRLQEALGSGDIATVLFLWPYAAYREVRAAEELSRALELGVYSLLELIRSLATRAANRVRLVVVTARGQGVLPDEPVAYEYGAIPGLLRSASHELEWLACRHVDLELTGQDAGHLLAELGSADRRTEVAYRGGRRLVSRLAWLDMRREMAGPLPLSHGALYLITGGLGGIGRILARHLAEHFDARLLLVGRTPVPEAGPEEALYEPADISDLQALQRAVRAAEDRFHRPLAGVFHCAGELQLAQHWREAERHGVLTEEAENFRRMYAAKVFGTWNLFRLMQERRDSLLVLFSSLAGQLGAASFSAYSSANSFLDACCLHHRAGGYRNSFCIDWSMWTEVGMSAGNPAYARVASEKTGHLGIGAEEGWHSLLAALRSAHPQLLVGLNAHNRNVRDLLEKAPPQGRKIQVYFASRNGAEVAERLAMAFRRETDSLDLPVEVRQVPEIPLAPDGSADSGRLLASEPGAADRPEGREEEQDPTASAVRQIWQDVLRRSGIASNDNFFDLGGNSLSFTQVLSRLRTLYNLEIPLPRLFEAPTLAAMTELVATLLWARRQEQALPAEDARRIRL